MQRKALKRMLRNQFVQFHDYSYGKPKPSEQPAEETPEEPESSTATQEPEESAGLLDDILAGITKTQKSKPAKQKEPSELSIETGYQYSVFNCASRKLLIRSRPPYQILEASDQKKGVLSNKKVTFEPRIEYLPNGGAMDLSAEEWVWNYTKRLLKQSDAHLLYRTSYKLDNVLQIDAISMDSKICEPPPLALAMWAFFFFNSSKIVRFSSLTTRTVMLEELLIKLESLPVGEYLAYQQISTPSDDSEEPTEHLPKRPLIVVPKCEPPNGVSTVSMKITKDLIKAQSGRIGDDWFYGFSPEVALQWQIVQGRAPRLLLAKDSPMHAFVSFWSFLNLKFKKCFQVPSRNSIDKLQRKQRTIKRKFDKISDAKSSEKRNKLDLDDPNLYADFTNPAVLSASHEGRGNNGSKWRGKHRGRGKPRGRGGNWRGAGRKPNNVADPGASSAPSNPFSP